MKYIEVKWLNVIVKDLLLLSPHRDQAKKREKAEMEGPRGEEHLAALKDLR